MCVVKNVAVMENKDCNMNKSQQQTASIFIYRKKIKIQADVSVMCHNIWHLQLELQWRG